MLAKDGFSETTTENATPDPRVSVWHPMLSPEATNSTDAKTSTLVSELGSDASRQAVTGQNVNPPAPDADAKRLLALRRTLIALFGTCVFVVSLLGIGLLAEPVSSTVKVLVFFLPPDALGVAFVIWLWRDKGVRPVRASLKLLVTIASVFLMGYAIRFQGHIAGSGDGPFLALIFAVDALAIYAIYNLRMRAHGSRLGFTNGNANPIALSTTSSGLSSEDLQNQFQFVGEVNSLQAYTERNEKGWQFRLQCFDNSGNPISPIEVFVPIQQRDPARILQGDRVEVMGKWTSSSLFRARVVRNLKTGAVISTVRFPMLRSLASGALYVGGSLCIISAIVEVVITIAGHVGPNGPSSPLNIPLLGGGAILIYMGYKVSRIGKQ